MRKGVVVDFWANHVLLHYKLQLLLTGEEEQGSLGKSMNIGDRI